MSDDRERLLTRVGLCPQCNARGLVASGYAEYGGLCAHHWITLKPGERDALAGQRIVERIVERMQPRPSRWHRLASAALRLAELTAVAYLLYRSRRP